METAVISNALLTYFALTKWIYKDKINNLLELVCLLNLSITSIVILFKISDGKRSPAAIFTSTSIALMIFFAIVIYHTVRKILSTRFVAYLKPKILAKVTQNADNQVNEAALTEEAKVVTTTTIELSANSGLGTPLLTIN